MLKFINFYFPEDAGAGGAAEAANNDELFEYVDNSVAESKANVNGIKAVNVPDTQGKPYDSGETATADDEPAVETDEKEPEDFESLIEGRYKKDFQSKVDGIINKRFRQNKKNEELIKQFEAEKEMLAPLFKAMGAKYGIDPTDVKAIVEAADKDNSNFEQAAYDNGFDDAESFRKHTEREEELNRLREQERVRKETELANKQRQELIEGWLEESTEFKKEIPTFDFKNEWNNNERFRYLVNSGFSVKDAYKSTHFDDYLQAERKRAQDDILREVRMNHSRPIESNANANAAIRVKKSIKDMSLEDTERVIREAKSGKTIVF